MHPLVALLSIGVAFLVAIAAPLTHAGMAFVSTVANGAGDEGGAASLTLVVEMLFGGVLLIACSAYALRHRQR